MKFNKKKIVITLLLATLSLCVISAVNAETISINPKTSNIEGYNSVVSNAKDGDTILLENGVYKLKKSISISSSITFKGKGSKVILDGGKKTGILFISGEKVLVENIKFRNGEENEGAAIMGDGYQKLTVSKCTFTNNRASSYGGAIFLSESYVSKPEMIVKNCIFYNNKAKYGGAIYDQIYDNSKSKITVNKCTFKSNQATEADGGAIYTSSKSQLIVKSSKFSKNQAKGNGGAIRFDIGKLYVSKCTFTSNKAHYTGAIVTSGTTSNIVDSKFTKNSASNDGGAVFSGDGKLTVSKSTFISNQVKGLGGGAIDAMCDLKITNSIFKKNIQGKKYIAITYDDFYKFTKKNLKISPKDGTKVKK